VRAAEKFDYRKGFKFSTTRLVDPPGDRPCARRQGAHDSHSGARREKLNKIGRAERKLVTELGREPTPDEIAAVTGIDPDEVDSIKRSRRRRFPWRSPSATRRSPIRTVIADERAESPV